MESDVPKSTTLCFRSKASSLRPISNAGDEDIGPVAQFHRRMHELLERVGPSMRPGVHHHESIAPPELSPHFVIPGTGPERFDIGTVWYEAESGVYGQTSPFHISLKRRR